MKFKDLFNFRLSEVAAEIKGGKTDDDLEVDLETQTLPDDRVIEYEALEVGAEVFLIVEGEDPALIKDTTLDLAYGQKLVIDADGKISEIKPKEEKKEEEMAAELSEEQKEIIALAATFDLESLKTLVDTKKNGYHTVEFSIQDGNIVWDDLYSNTFKTLLDEQVNPIQTKLEAEEAKVVDLEAKIKVLQELNEDKEKNPIKGAVKLEDEKPLTTYEKRIGLI